MDREPFETMISKKRVQKALSFSNNHVTWAGISGRGLSGLRVPTRRLPSKKPVAGFHGLTSAQSHDHILLRQGVSCGSRPFGVPHSKKQGRKAKTNRFSFHVSFLFRHHHLHRFPEAENTSRPPPTNQRSTRNHKK